MKKSLVILFVLAVSLPAFNQESAVDSLRRLIGEANEEAQRYELRAELIEAISAGDLPNALTEAKTALAEAEESENREWIPHFSEMRGRIHANLGHLDTAAVLFANAVDGYDAVGNKKGIATATFKIAWVQQHRGQYDEAMKSNLAALRIMEELENEEGIADALARLSGNLYNQENYREALDYAERAMTACRENGFDRELTSALYQAGYAAIGLREYPVALGYFDEALALVKSLEMGAASEADMYNGRGNALKKLERYEEAIAAYENTFAKAEKAGYFGGMNTAKANLGEVHLRTGNYGAALPYQLEITKQLEEGGNLRNLTENYGHLSTIYEGLGDYENALVFQKKARRMRDSTASIEADRAMSQLRTEYETEKKEATISTQEAKIGQQNLVLWLIAGLVILVGLFAFSFYRNAAARKLANAKLQVKNEENELLLREIHHRVKNNLEVVSGLLALQSAQIDDQGIKDAMREGQNRVQSIGIVHQKLYQGTELGSVEMRDYFVNLSEHILDSFGADERVTIECAMGQLELDIDTAIPLGLIVNEVLTNALKHAFPEGRRGKIEIKLEQSDRRHLRMHIVDNGVGKTEAVTTGTGFGSQLISLLTQQLNGSMTESTARGTAVSFDFELKEVA